ncbi:MAG TPA: tRNA preQ1(34) S-adenosylmethionine ribosyltransferase-isomerase QueA, partial [Thermoanaerobaculia bacterium]
GTSAPEHRRFADLPSQLRPGDLLVRNDVGVRPARLYGKDGEDRLVEIFLVRREDDVRWRCLTKPGRRAKAGRAVRFDEGIAATVETVHPDGSRTVRFDPPLEDDLLWRIGRTPLPPYIRREPGAADSPEDRGAYQTVFARENLAVAAPTAGLHFTTELLGELSARGVEIADLTLEVGPGTFKPVTARDSEEHRMDAERVALPRSTMDAVARAKREDRRVVAVGTTVTRALEAWERLEAKPSGDPARFSTDLFITPGFPFRVVDVLLTNFHLPRSTLLMLVSAFAGRERLLAAYEEALRQRYLFYSFGDAMLIEGDAPRP